MHIEEKGQIISNMKVMTFNIRADNILDIHNRWDKRKEIVCETIKKYDCDIIGLQEVTSRMHRDICESMGEYNIVGKGRTKHFFSERNSVLIKKEYKILKYETFWLSKTPKKAGSTVWYSLFPRICTTVTCQTPTKEKIRVYNTHLDCLSPLAREFGLKKIMEIINQYNKEKSLPCILMGDFNATPNSKLIKAFTNGRYIDKSFVAVQEFDKELYKKATRGTFKGKEYGTHIDYIFTSEEFNICYVEVIRDNKKGKYPSDHYPIVADIEI